MVAVAVASSSVAAAETFDWPPDTGSAADQSSVS